MHWVLDCSRCVSEGRAPEDSKPCYNGCTSGARWFSGERELCVEQLGLSGFTELQAYIVTFCFPTPCFFVLAPAAVPSRGSRS